MNKTVLIADSGSTKTDWILIRPKSKKRIKTQGIHPYFQSIEDIKRILEQELTINPKRTTIDEIHFYGAGINSKDSSEIIKKSLKRHFGAKKVNTHSDMLAAARASCQFEKGIACILGTGSNSCYYNGKRIAMKHRSLGFVLGDEGGGNHLGRKVVQYYLHGLFDDELKSAFEKVYNADVDLILNSIYRKPFPNRYLATFASFVFENRGHYMMENIAEDCLNEFFINHLIRYKKVQSLPVHFSGSVAFYLKDVLERLCAQYGISLGKITQRPILDLVKYHKQALTN